MKKGSHGDGDAVSSFNGVKVFCATLIHQRQTLGEAVTAWIEEARRQRPGFEVVDIKVAQSSDDAFHCVSIIIVFNENLGGVGKAKKSHG